MCHPKVNLIPSVCATFSKTASAWSGCPTRRSEIPSYTARSGYRALFSVPTGPGQRGLSILVLQQQGRERYINRTFLRTHSRSTFVGLLPFLVSLLGVLSASQEFLYSRLRSTVLLIARPRFLSFRAQRPRKKPPMRRIIQPEGYGFSFVAVYPIIVLVPFEVLSAHIFYLQA